MTAGNHGSTLKTGVLLALERAINSSLAYDPMTQQALSVLDGKVLHVVCTVPAHSVYVLFVDAHVELWSLFEGVADTTLSGSLTAFLNLWRHRQRATALAESQVSLTGDTALLQQLQQIAATVDIDWEALLAEHTGDVIAHQLGRAARGASNWLSAARHEAERLLQEFLQFENQAAPSRHEVAQFCQDVDAVQLRMDRLQAGIAAFAARRQQNQE